MLRAALTGGIATGKSYVLSRLQDCGIRAIDADDVAHRVLGPGTEASREVAELFGREFVHADGRANRLALAEKVFGDESARRRLEGIVHPRVYRAIDEWFTQLQEPIGVAVIPLLYETGRERDFDFVAATLCSTEQQLERLQQRGLSEADARARMAAQMPAEQKAGRADFVIMTGGTRLATDRQVEVLEAELRRRSAR